MPVSGLSFDLWKTFLQPNETYSMERSRIIGMRLAPTLLFEQVHQIVQRVKKEMDELTINTNGEWYGFKDRLRAIYELLPQDVRIPTLDQSMIDLLYREVTQLIHEYPPTLIESDLPAILKTLKGAGLKIAVLSNTGFIDGIHMRVALETRRVSPYVDAFIFSNEVGHAKPSPKMFAKMVAELGLPPSEIIHIGDDYDADIIGGQEAGLRTLHFNPKGGADIRSIREVLDHLN